MKPTQQQIEQYERNRTRKYEVNKKMRLYFWANIMLAAGLFAFSIFAGAFQSRRDMLEGPEKFYFAMASGFFQIFAAVVTVVLGFIASAGKRLPTLILAALNLIFIILTVMLQNGVLVYSNIFFLLLGLGLNLWVQTVFSEDDDLREQPGYPLFSIDADFRAEYEAPIYVTQRRSSQDMDTVGTPAAADVSAKQESGVSLAKAGGLKESDLTEFIGSGTKAQSAAPQITGDVSLAAFSENVQAGVKAEALPTLDAEQMLADMTAIPAKPNYSGDVSALPTPEEVMARLAAMKKDQQNGGQ